MNFSRLIKAMALVGLVGFGSHVLGAVPGIDDFESYDVGLFKDTDPAPVDWTVNSADLSEIVTSLVTELGEMPQCVTNYYGADYATTPTNTQVLELNTEGNDLTYAAASDDYATVAVNTLLKVVGSDTAPTIDDAQVQTAVYLNTTDSKLYAYSTVDGDNAWTQLTTTVTNGQWICLKIEIDYTTGYGTQTPYATVYVDGAAAGAAFVVANKTQSFTKRSIDSVSFRGTGMVDNFSVSQTASGLQFATIVTEAVTMDGGAITDDAPGTEYQIGSATFNQDMALFVSAYPQYELVEVNLLDGTKTSVLQSLTDPVSIAVNGPTFTNNGTYYVQGKYAIITNEVAVDYQGAGAPADPAPAPVVYDGTFTLDLNGVIELDGTLEIDAGAYGFFYVGDLVSGVLSIPNVVNDLTVVITGTYPSAYDVVIDDNNSLEWTTVATGDPVTFSFTANGSVSTSPTQMAVLVSETVNGSVIAVTGTVKAVENAGVVTGTVEVDAADLSAYDTLFFRGFRYE